MKKVVFFAVCCVLPLLEGFAIITTNNISAGQAPVGFDWNYVVNFNGSSSVAIDPYWLLTAAHVADDFGNTSVMVNGQTYNQMGEIFHATADLALIQLDRALPGFYTVYSGTYPTTSKNKLNAIMVGYGVTGTVVDQYNYTFASAGKGTERWGSNKIDGQLNYIGATGKTNSGFQMYFNTADSVLEAGAGTGDSGGGVFVNDSGIWKLAGIMTDVSTGGSQDAVYAIDAQDYSSWIMQTVPEATTGVLFVGIGIVFGVIRRIRYMYQ
jgi:hypothetical protein